ncbi:hypothetical protein P153DRAFT_370970 [Dothidotthia symphoricarpi CBS 119687]|uniref:Glycoside hydrolase family 43 protein n=1 Tax=Dothidotthia symphoricarpi CBS 119687 TaxID=1392245 RepID=A0A6A5ZZY5_9PLEO|nr:uncharacterized protein P153DRAFT_370970 [Dothidotthia symphoricarpi CBS 119687]KAF2124575.1 hypothetical protein P153DRAFT_370970 [Dothidotthia symphoricarpi CBS 119687]
MAALIRFAMLCALPLGALGAVKRATAAEFPLFGYGGMAIGGLPLYYLDGYAYLGDPKATNDAGAAVVTFTSTDDNKWIASPNITTTVNGTTPSWSNETLYIPASIASDKRVGFFSSNSTNSSEITTGFSFYGTTASLLTDDGQLQTLWTVSNETGKPRALYWNDYSLGQVSVILRSIGPSNPPLM